MEFLKKYKLQLLLLIGTSFSLLLYIYFDFSDTNSNNHFFIKNNIAKNQIQNLKEKQTLNQTAQTTPAAQIKEIKLPDPQSETQIWNQWLNHEAQNISQLTNDPKLVQDQIIELAQKIPNEKLPWLRERALNDSLPMDDRFFSTELLVLNHSDETLIELEKIATQPIDKNLSPALKNESVLLKAQAIEGFTDAGKNKEKAKAVLLKMSGQIEDTFLSDRLQRSLWSLNGKAPLPEEQDQKALKEILKGSK